MTFKHVKFQDSPVMRSLEKVAKEKGLVKEEDLTKTASKKISLEPGGNLLVNLLKLADGLRDAGFEKQADDLETKALVYKQAQTLYETSKEKGEDLIDAAHPKGSHKLEDVDGDEAVFETIIDQQLKNIKMVEKEPTGKLASSDEILSEVKIALGAGPWSSLLGLLGKGTAPAFTAELAPAGTGAAAASGVGAGEAAAGGLLATPIAGAGMIAASVAAVLASAIAGGYVGSKLFSHYYEATELQEAGERVLSEAKDMQTDFKPEEYVWVTKFARSLSQIVDRYKVVSKVKDGNINTGDLQLMKEVNDLIYQSRKEAGAILGYSNAHVDEQFLGNFRGFKGVALAASNYLNVAMKVNAAFDDFAQEAAAAAQKKIQERVSSTGGEPVALLNSNYQNTLSDLSKYNDIVKAKQLPNAAGILSWLQKAKDVVTSEQQKFQKVEDANKPAVVKFYADRLNNNLKPKIKAFADKWMV